MKEESEARHCDGVLGSGPRVMAIGLDAADPGLLRQWVAEGHLPNLARLIEEGVCADVRTPPGMADDAVWSSFSTGVWPDDHGRFDYRALSPGHYEPIRWRNDMYVHQSFWEVLDRADVRCVVLDVPKSPQVTLRRGIEVNNFRVHGIDGALMSRPPEVAARLAQRYAVDPTDRPENDHFLCAPGSFSPQQRSAFVELIIQSIADKTEVALDLLDTECDLFLTVFKEAHCAGHKLWPPGPDMLVIYAQLDRSLGRLVERAGEHTTVLVFSALGMAANHHGTGALDTVLRRIECQHAGFGGTMRSASARLGRRLRARLGGTAAPDPRPMADRLAFVVPHNEISGAIRVNLAGRESSGRVQPGKDYRSLCDLIEREMRLLCNAESGRPVVREVVRLDLEQGVRHDLLPDLLIVWDRTEPIMSVSSPTMGTLRLHSVNDSPGNHVEGGFVVVSGSGVSCRSPLLAEGGVCDIIDLAPTIGTLLGVELPGTAGRPLPAVTSPTEGL